MGEQPYIADRTLYLDANGKVVEADDPAKLTKLISPGLPLPMARARELGLVPEPEPEAKAVEAAPENKARTSSSRKAGK